MVMAEEEENAVSIRPEFPNGRVKKIMRLDKDVERVSSEALFLVSSSTELFLQFLAEKSARVAIEKKRKTVKLEHIRIAVKRHQPTSDFLLDSLPLPSQPAKSDKPDMDRAKPDKPAPAGTRRIDNFFRKPEAEAQAPVPVDES
ncbi:NCT transcriptional regulatory complex subunit A [Gastrolobium bilobum]|uniref:NCT transcriptional regulatory complex subunit A n=1 Tax=Gastrolobium bilobum TaxID=150636 RepID=UPI002AB15A2B|nr:NCT transcriptional regulatory complex subunit A [Gastrolobium bilobum]